MLTPTKEIRIETSTVCNFHCRMCPRSTLERPREIMSNEFFTRIAAAAKEAMPHLDMCTVSGFGEFAADPDWLTKLEIAGRLYPKVHVVTNLSLIDDELIPQLAALATEIRVSINALGDERFAVVHRPPPGVSFSMIERRIRMLSELRGPDLRLRLSLSVVDENVDQITAWIDYWEGIVDGVEVWTPHNWVDGKAFRKFHSKRLSTCDRPASGPLQVQVDGTMNVCCFDYNGLMLIGDLKDQTFAEILDGAELQRIRELHSTGRADELPLCAVCDQRDPPEAKQEYMVHCSFEQKSERVVRTSSGYERIATGDGGEEE